MSLRRRLQDHPFFLVQSWRLTEALLGLLAAPLKAMKLETASSLVKPVEKPLKRLLFDCQMCGQCVLHYTGMTCPMTCPKQLRNGPCGGVCLDGTCEVYPDRRCVWLDALERIERTPYKEERLRLNPPVDWRLHDLASWVTLATGRDQIATGSDREPRYASEVID